FAIFIVFALVNLAVIMLRFSNPKAKRSFSIPLTVSRVPLPAVLGIFICLALLLNLGFEVIAGGVLVTLVGAIISFFATRKR
ncbi:MAG: amino acid transporter, partial [Candidatus Micrarchaeota archaeon]